MSNDKLKVRIENGQTIDVVVLSQRASGIQIVLGEGFLASAGASHLLRACTPATESRSTVPASPRKRAVNFMASHPSDF